MNRLSEFGELPRLLTEGFFGKGATGATVTLGKFYPTAVTFCNSITVTALLPVTPSRCVKSQTVTLCHAQSKGRNLAKLLVAALAGESERVNSGTWCHLKFGGGGPGEVLKLALIRAASKDRKALK